MHGGGGSVWKDEHENAGFAGRAWHAAFGGAAAIPGGQCRPDPGWLGAYFYTAGPVQLGYRGVGEVVIGFLFGILPVFGSYYLQAQSFGILPLLPALIFAMRSANQQDLAKPGLYRANQLTILLHNVGSAALAAGLLLPGLVG